MAEKGWFCPSCGYTGLDTKCPWDRSVFEEEPGFLSWAEFKVFRMATRLTDEEHLVLEKRGGGFLNLARILLKCPTDKDLEQLLCPHKEICRKDDDPNCEYDHDHSYKAKAAPSEVSK